MKKSYPSELKSKVVEKARKMHLLIPLAFLMVFLGDIALMYLSFLAPSQACLVVILIGLVSAFGFIWMEIKEPKKLLVLVTLVFLLAAPVYSFMYTDSLYSMEYPMDVDYSNYPIKTVGVSPYTGNGGASYFNFTASVPGNMSHMYAKLRIMDEITLDTVKTVNMSSYFSENNTVFYSNTELGQGRYAFQFLLYNNSEKMNGTDMAYFFGPQNMDKTSFAIQFIPYSLVIIFVNISGFSYILIGLYWWTRWAKKEKRKAVTVRKDEEGTKCPICGNRIPEGTKTCPYCGAELEYSDGKPDAEEEKVSKDVEKKSEE